MSNGTTGHDIVFVYDEDGLFDIQGDAAPFDLTGGIQGSMANVGEGLVVSGFACTNDKNCK
ncbi:MAG: hypothetical protein AAGC76_02155 [Luteibacter sp.]|uniref:hypothetical protein n=1 Tax=Luteibacter TaxID=242605 RepID=UPI0005686C07|nr:MULTISPECIES: hypothetical protein [unclassified Luteibacter]MDQ7994636.1 hypothetical protein [Luteibacter sp.]MDQ8048209.1 hypothetical protein [Luteibacter sp.]MDR6641876.1 hypothetical protein [Luteibacter sp. 1214]